MDSLQQTPEERFKTVSPVAVVVRCRFQVTRVRNVIINEISGFILRQTGFQIVKRHRYVTLTGKEIRLIVKLTLMHCLLPPIVDLIGVLQHQVHAIGSFEITAAFCLLNLFLHVPGHVALVYIARTVQRAGGGLAQPCTPVRPELLMGLTATLYIILSWVFCVKV